MKMLTPICYDGCLRLLTAIVGIVVAISTANADPAPADIKAKIISEVKFAPSLLRYGGESGAYSICTNAKTTVEAYDYDPELSGYVERCLADVAAYGPLGMTIPKGGCESYQRAKEHFATAVQAGNSNLKFDLQEANQIIREHCNPAIGSPSPGKARQ